MPTFSSGQLYTIAHRVLVAAGVGVEAPLHRVGLLGGEQRRHLEQDRDEPGGEVGEHDAPSLAGPQDRVDHASTGSSVARSWWLWSFCT